MHTKIQPLLRRALYVILLLGIFLFSAGGLSFAHAQDEVSLFTEIDTFSMLDAPIPPLAAVRSRSVGINFSVLSGPQGDVGSQSLEGGAIQMNLFEDTVYDVVIDSIEESASGGTAWNGHIDGLIPSYAYMVYTDGVFAAHIASLEGVYEVQYTGENVYTVSQLDQSLYPDDIVLEPVLPKNALPPVEPDVSAQAITYIDVMVVYTSRAVTAVGGLSAMNARVDLAVQETNQSYINSNVNQRINLVYKGEITYNEGANPDFGTTLDRLTGKVDGHMDSVHSLRDSYNADLVSLFIEGTQYCGIAWLMNSVSVSFESSAFSVVAQSCATGYYSFAHEMGHNMGSRHDTYVDSNNTPYPYSHGFTYPAGGWRSIMAYNNACIVAGTNCTRLQYWSNPTVNYGGVAMGNASNADNHASLNNTAATVAAFRTGTALSFNKSSPPNGATNQLVANLNLSWDTSPEATQYEVCYDTSNNNNCDSSWQNLGNATSTTITGLSNNTTYSWQVRAYNGSSYTSANSGTWWSFTTVAAALPGAFSKLEPANEAANQPIAPTLVWEQSTGAISYAYCYDTSNNNNCDSSWISTGTATADALSGLSPNTTYYWQARATNSSGSTSGNSNVWWSFTTVAPSSNDDFLGATQITTLPYNNPGTQNTVTATSDTTDPTFPCSEGGKKSNTVWFKYTPGSATTFYVDTGGSDYDTVLAVWTGNEGSLTNVACNDDFNGLQSQVMIHGAAGTTYYIEVASFNPDAAGWLDLHVSTIVPPPSNDDIVSATMIGLPYLNWINIEGATTDVTDPVLPCGPGTQAYQSVWFRYTPASSGEVVLSTYTSGYDTVLAVWSGTEGDLTNIACNDDFRGTTSLLTADLTGGSTYYIEVVKYSETAPTDYWLYLNLVHVGDDFDVPFILNPSLPSTTTLNTANYSYFLDDPDFTACNVIGTNSVWFKFEPSQSGTLNVNTVGSGYDTLLGVWSGDRAAPLTPLGCDDDSAGNFVSDLSVPIAAGNTYYIEVIAWWGNLDGTTADGKPPHTGSPDLKKQLNGISAQSGGTLTLNLSFEGVKTYIGGALQGNYHIGSGSSTRQSYSGANNGPVEITNTNGTSILAAERVIYKINGVNTSFSEMMALPNSQLNTTYWLPWYNNVDLDTQLRFANISGSTASVRVYIGGVEMTGSPFTLLPGESTRQSFAGINSGPVKIQSDQTIVAAERVIYKINGVNTSFSEMMALPNSQLNTTYWLPWYNNVDLDTQLRFANVSDQTATVHVYIGDTEVTPGSGITLLAGESTRVSYAGVNDGPVQIVSTQNIVAAERVIYRINNIPTSFSEMMALPDSQLNTTYWLPWYNNVDLDTQLRIANVSGADATVHVYIGGTEMAGSPFSLAAGTSTRRTFAGINNGPVEIVSNQTIVAAERVIYKINGVNTSFSEMMGLPDGLLDITYWLPWYNNIDLDTQIRFGTP
jgi:peptidyl-Asp metalloendopeptidase